MQQPLRKLYFETIRIGDELPVVAKAPIDRVQLARYAGATGDFNPMWVDDHYARAAGMPSVMAPPGLAIGFLGQLISQWGRGAQLQKFDSRLSRMVWPGDTLVCKGRVFDRHGHNGHYFVELELWAENQRGELAAKGHATLKVFYSAEDEQRARNGQAPVVVNVARSSLVVAAAAKAATPVKVSKSPPKKAKPKPKPKPKPKKRITKSR